MHPTISYWPPTRSPACSFGVNENGARHFEQKPSVRPGLPGADRPTGAPHEEQNRLSSGTCGLASTTDFGSGTGADGTVVMPAPRCWMRLLAATSRRVGRLDTLRAEPIGVLASFEEIPDARTLVECSPAAGWPLPLTGVVGAVTGRASAAPHTLQ